MTASEQHCESCRLHANLSVCRSPIPWNHKANATHYVTATDTHLQMQFKLLYWQKSSHKLLFLNKETFLSVSDKRLSLLKAEILQSQRAAHLLLDHSGEHSTLIHNPHAWCIHLQDILYQYFLFLKREARNVMNACMQKTEN